MNNKIKYLVLSTLCGLPVMAQATIEDDAQKVLLQTSCTVNGNILDNCFEDMNTMNTWIFNTRVRSKTNPLLVEIGPGLFYTSQFTCEDEGYITLRGSGRQHTTIKSNGGYTLALRPECNLDVENLRIEDRDPISLGAVNIGSSLGGAPGKTTWNNVDIDSKAYGWTESGCSGSTHYWFGSRINVRTGFGIARGYSTCSISWFYGSEITATATGGSEAIAIIGKGGGNETHFYGGNLRVLAGDGINMQSAAKGDNSAGVVKGLVAVSAGPQDEIHIHGTGIDVISAEANNTAALLGWNDSFIHASESSYAMKTGAGGTKTRILPYSNTDIRAPHDWHQGTTAPDIVSVTGADNFVDIGGAFPVMYIYNSNCASSGGPWSDLSGQCRL